MQSNEKWDIQIYHIAHICLSIHFQINHVRSWGLLRGLTLALRKSLNKMISTWYDADCHLLQCFQWSILWLFKSGSCEKKCSNWINWVRPYRRIFCSQSLTNKPCCAYLSPLPQTIGPYHLVNIKYILFILVLIYLAQYILFVVKCNICKLFSSCSVHWICKSLKQ